MATHAERTQDRVNRQSSGMDSADAQAKAEALNAELALLQAQARALLRTVRTSRFHF